MEGKGSRVRESRVKSSTSSRRLSVAWSLSFRSLCGGVSCLDLRMSMSSLRSGERGNMDNLNGCVMFLFNYRYFSYESLLEVSLYLLRFVQLFPLSGS